MIEFEVSLDYGFKGFKQTDADEGASQVKLQDAVYKRRGWTQDGTPTVETVKRLGIDFPEVMDLLRTHEIE